MRLQSSLWVTRSRLATGRLQLSLTKRNSKAFYTGLYFAIVRSLGNLCTKAPQGQAADRDDAHRGWEAPSLP